MKRENLIKMLLSSMFLAIGVVLPLLTMQIKEIGDTLLPMHIPVMLCGLICGYWYGFSVGLILPILRSFIFGLPPLYPNSLWMATELATYGLVIGLIYSLSKKKNIFSIYLSLITAMLSGRIVWGISKYILLGLNNKPFTFTAFISGGFVDCLLGIIIQLILIPVIIKTIQSIKRC